MKKIIFIGFLFLTISFFGQSKSVNNLSEFARVNIGLHGIDLSYEFPIAKKIVWENSVGLGMGSNSYNSSANYKFLLNNPVPYLKSELKYVYNTKKRLSKDKTIDLNSGNYVGLQSKYSFGDVDYYELNKTLLTEVHWGIQRPLGGRFTFNTHIGLGVLKDFDTKNAQFSPTIGMKFGYKLF